MEKKRPLHIRWLKAVRSRLEQGVGLDEVARRNALVLRSFLPGFLAQPLVFAVNYVLFHFLLVQAVLLPLGGRCRQLFSAQGLKLHKQVLKFRTETLVHRCNSAPCLSTGEELDEAADVSKKERRRSQSETTGTNTTAEFRSSLDLGLCLKLKDARLDSLWQRAECAAETFDLAAAGLPAQVDQVQADQVEKSVDVQAEADQVQVDQLTNNNSDVTEMSVYQSVRSTRSEEFVDAENEAAVSSI